MNKFYTITRYSFRRSVWAIIGWGIPLMLLGIITIPFYDLVAENEKQLRPVLENLKPLVKSFVGGDEVEEIFTPQGFIALRYFAFLPVILGIYGSVSGSGLLAADEERGILDFVLAHPVSRGQLFWGRVVAFTVSLSCIIGLGWLGLWIGVAKAESMNFSPFQLVLPYLSVFVVTWFFACFSLALSMCVPSRSSAAMISGIVVLAGYIITTLSKAIKGLESWAIFSPLTYYQSNAMKGLEIDPFIKLFLVALLFLFLARTGFRFRDIRVAGDGGWKLPFIKS
ncbi:MAG: ABC transporter permease subunit [Verrucomicrobiota bacterium]|nr:ABC transporter permease subunit [Verrucomicrobiota bacterium]MEC9327381.1 ABC transporter permease subunit [Verrucomicrobiota bacterium]